MRRPQWRRNGGSRHFFDAMGIWFFPGLPTTRPTPWVCGKLCDQAGIRGGRSQSRRITRTKRRATTDFLADVHSQLSSSRNTSQDLPPCSPQTNDGVNPSTVNSRGQSIYRPCYCGRRSHHSRRSTRRAFASSRRSAAWCSPPRPPLPRHTTREDSTFQQGGP